MMADSLLAGGSAIAMLGLWIMVQISVANDFNRLESAIQDLRLKHLPFATARALTDVAVAARQSVVQAMPTIFDRPTPFTVGGIKLVPATKSSLAAEIFVMDRQARYLLLEETGGIRTPDMSGKPGVALTLPGKGARENAYGNLPARYQASLRDAAARERARREDRQEAVRSARRRRKHSVASAGRDRGIFYVADHGPHGVGSGGYFRRGEGHKLIRLIGYASTESYRPRFGFQDRVTRVAREMIGRALMSRLREAIASGK